MGAQRRVGTSEVPKAVRGLAVGRAALFAAAAVLVLAAAPARAAEQDPIHIADPAARAVALRASLAPERRAKLSEYDRAVRSERFAATLRELKQGAELRAFAAEMEQTDKQAGRRQNWCFLQAEALREDGQSEPALAGYERVFIDYPDESARWSEAQARIVDVLVAVGRTNDALRAAHVLWDAAGDGHGADRAAARMAELLKDSDGGPARADALLARLRHGPAGKDGVAGNGDDPADVLAVIGYPDAKARRTALAQASSMAADSTDAAILRGYGLLYAAAPRDALTHFVDALRRCPAAKTVDAVRAVKNGSRALRGHPVGLDAVGRFIAWGPAGPDRATGTADDVADPFVAAGLPGAAQRPEGVAPPSTSEAAHLKALVAEIRAFAVGPANPGRRAAALAAWERTCEAGAFFDRAEAQAWILGRLGQEDDATVLGALFRLGQSVSKAGDRDLSRMVAFERAMAEALAATGKSLPAPVADAQRQIERTLEALTK
jgi:hypothetical protein